MKNSIITKILAILVLMILLSFSINASIFATIGMKGLSFASPQAAGVVQNVMKVYQITTDPSGFITGEMTGKITGEIMGEIAKQSPEAAKAIQQYQQVKGWVDEGAKITEDLKLDDKGQLVGGSVTITKKQNVESVTDKKISEIENMQLSSNGEGNPYQLKASENGASTTIGGNTYSNLQKDSTITIDRETGKIGEMDATFTEATTIKVNEDEIKALKGERLVYKNGEYEIYGKDQIVEINKQKIQINGENSIGYDGKKITGKDFTYDEKRFTGIGDEPAEMTPVEEDYLLGKDTKMEDDRMIVTSEKGNALYSKMCGDVSGFNNYVNPCAKKLTAEGNGFSVRLKEGKQFGLDIENDDVFEYRLEDGKVVLDNGEQTIIPQKNGKIFVTNGVTTEYKEVDGEVQALISDPNNMGEVDVSMTTSYDDSQLETLADEETGIENTRVCPVENPSVTTGAVKNIGSITTLAEYECQGVVSLGGKNNILTDKQIKGMKWGKDTVTNVYPVKKYVNPTTKEVSYGRIIETVGPDGTAQTFITSDGKGYELSISGLPSECCFDVKGDLNKFGLEYTGTTAPTAEEAGMKWERESLSSSPTKESALDEKARKVLSGSGISGQEYTLGKVGIGSPGIPVLQNGKPIDYVKRVSLSEGRIGYISVQDGDTTYELVNGKLRLAR